MILTGKKIIESVENGDVIISNFDCSRVNPNSYNYLLGEEVKVFSGKCTDGYPRFDSLRLGADGYVLQPGSMCLGVTDEVIGSPKYAMSLIGRSSMGRFGLFLQISANLGHTTSSHQWTLELHATRAIRIYPKMSIGQVSFWTNYGSIRCLGKHYALCNTPTERLRT